MEDRVKRTMDEIPIPPELRERSKQGIAQAAAETEPDRARERRVRRWLAASAAGLFLLAGATQHEQVAAAIQRALQFVPGIGMVLEEEAPGSRYVLEEPVEVRDGLRRIVVTGFVSDERMVYIEVSGEHAERYEEVMLLTSGGERHILKRSIGTWGSSGVMTLSFWHNGPLNVKGDVVLRFEGGNPIDIPLTLKKAATYGSYEEMGPTATASGVSITAIVSRVGERGRVSLVSQAPDAYRIASYEGVFGVPEARRMRLTEEASGTILALESQLGILNPANEFFFDAPPSAAGETASRTYTLTIPELDVGLAGTAKVEVDVPEPGIGVIETNIPFRIAGQPVTITGLERVKDNGMRVYVDFHYDETASLSLYKLHIASVGHSAKFDERTGVYQYLELPVEAGVRRTTLEFDSPGAVLRGPWVMKLGVPSE